MSTSETFYLVRHGETRLTGAFCGSSNPRLAPRGQAQARAAARHLSGVPIDVCYCSPLLRARQTASIINHRLKVRLISNPLLKEIDFGVWEGLRFAQMEKKWPSLAKQWARDPMAVRIPRAEPFSALRRRVKRFLALIRKPMMGRNILIVAHGGSLSAIVLELLGLPNHEFPNFIPKPGSVRVMKGRRIKFLC